MLEMHGADKETCTSTHSDFYSTFYCRLPCCIHLMVSIAT